MIKHLKSFSNYENILMISENDYYSKVTNESWFKNMVLQKLGIHIPSEDSEEEGDVSAENKSQNLKEDNEKSETSV